MRVFVFAAACVAAGGVAGGWVPDHAGGSVDFAEYGAAARVPAAGGNPYDPRSLLAHQPPAGWVGERPGGGKPTPDAQMMWNPPWAFPVVLPLAAVGWGPGFAAWVAAQLAAVLAAVWLLWRVYRGPGHLAAALFLAAAFPPVLFLLRTGQICGFSLLGLAGFLAGVTANRPALAGCALALTGVKPHLLLTFAAVAGAAAVTDRVTRRAVVAGAVVLAAAAAFPLAWRPTVWAEYAAATRAPTDEYHVAPDTWDPPVLAARLSGAYDRATGGGPGAMAVQFLPSVAGTAAALCVWWVRRRAWDRRRELPGLTLVCLLTTGYGAWGFDLVLLLVPLAQAAAWAAADGRCGVVAGAVGAYLGFTLAVLQDAVPVIGWTPAVAGP